MGSPWGIHEGKRWIIRGKPSGQPSPDVMGDVGPWPFLVSAMWRALADPSGTHAIPNAPKDAEPAERTIAYWAPLPELLRYSFGWRAADPNDFDDRRHLGLGLRRLREFIGEFADEPRVRLMHTVWAADDLGTFASWVLDDRAELAWLGDDRYLLDLEQAGQPVPSAAALALVRGGTDPLHLTGHWRSPLVFADELRDPGQFTFDASADPPTAVLVLDRYAGWATALELAGERLPASPTGRGWRVDVVVKPLGWLGTYRRSHQTGLWFSGRHALHVLGH